MPPFESDSFLTCAAFATISMHWIKARQDNVVDFMFLPEIFEGFSYKLS